MFAGSCTCLDHANVDAGRVASRAGLRTLTTTTMPNPDDDLLKRLLAHNREVRDEAKRILVQARSATGPGSGYDISDGKTGLAAICAYLATVKYVDCAIREFLPSDTV